MKHDDRNQPPRSGPFGMGLQGYLLVAIIIAATALFAATRSGWIPMLLSALLPPLILFPLIFALSRRSQDGARMRDSTAGPARDADPLTFLVRTNPFMFLLLAVAGRRTDEDRFRELLASGPYGMGRYGYLMLIALILTPLILTLIITALTGRQPAHMGLPIS